MTTRHVKSARRLTGLLNFQLALAGVIALAALVIEYGFRPPLPVGRNVLHAVQMAVVAIFILDRLVRLVLSTDRAAYFRENFVDFGLILAAAGAVAALSAAASARGVSKESNAAPAAVFPAASRASRLVNFGLFIAFSVTRQNSGSGKVGSRPSVKARMPSTRSG